MLTCRVFLLPGMCPALTATLSTTVSLDLKLHKERCRIKLFLDHWQPISWQVYDYAAKPIINGVCEARRTLIETDGAGLFDRPN